MLVPKVAASDFDGTLFREQQVTRRDIEAKHVGVKRGINSPSSQAGPISCWHLI